MSELISKRPRQLANRLLLATLAAMLLLWLAIFGWIGWEVVKVGNGYFDQYLRLLGHAYADFERLHGDTPQKAAAARALLNHFNHQQADPPMADDDFAYRLSRPSGELIAASDNWPALRPTLLPNQPLNEGEWRRLRVLSQDGQIQADVALRHRYIQASMFSLFVFLLLPLLLSLPLAYLLLRLAVRRGLQPLSELASLLRLRPPQANTPLPVPEQPYQELLPLHDALNALLSRLAAQRQHEQRFFADAAHELRTPMAAMAAQAHLLAYAPDSASRDEALQHLNQTMSRSANLIGKLLTLSRLDAESEQATAQPCDLAVLTRQAIARHAPRAIEQGQELYYEGPDAMPIMAQPDGMATLLDNLIDNALSYCPSGCEVAVQLSRNVGSVQLVVCDNGPGIPADWRQRITERFVRLPDSPANGSGLGLAIVSRLVAMHGGNLHLADGLYGKGLAVEIRLPL